MIVLRRSLRRILFAATLLWLAPYVRAQSGQATTPDQPKSGQVPDLHLGDWQKGAPLVPVKPGITLYFDYTKFFEWLLPKKHPKIPPECDPRFFQDSLPPQPIKRDTTIKQPV